MFRRTPKLIRTLSLIVLTVTACTSKSTPPPVKPATPGPLDRVLRVGVLGPFTGTGARTGDEFRGAVQMAFESIGYKVGNYKIKLVWIDSQSDPEKATRAYEEAIVGQGIEVGLLNWHSSVAVAVMEVAAKHRIPHFFGMGATELVNEKFHSDAERYKFWMAKGWPIPAKLSLAYVNALEDAITAGNWKPGEKKVAIWGEDTDWARSFGGAIRKQFENAGWRVVSQDYLAIEETQFLPLLARYKNLGVPVLAGTGTFPPFMSALIKQADELGLKSLVIADGLGWVGEWYELTGPASDLVIDQIPRWTTVTAKEFAANFKRRWGITPSPSAAGLSYDYSNFFIKILRTTLDEQGVLTSQAIYKTGREKLWTGKLTYEDGVVMPEYQYTQDSIPDPVVGKGHFVFPVLQYHGGSATVIWPKEWKTGNLQARLWTK